MDKTNDNKKIKISIRRKSELQAKQFSNISKKSNLDVKAVKMTNIDINHNYSSKEDTSRKNKNKKRFKFDLFTLFPQPIIIAILLYLINEYKTLMDVSIFWKNAILSALDNHFTKLENHLIAINSKNLIFLNSYTSHSQYNFKSKNCIRIDRIIQFEVNDRKVMKNLTLSYLFRYCNDSNYYKHEFKFDVVQAGPRTIWIHKNLAVSFIRTKMIK